MIERSRFAIWIRVLLSPLSGAVVCFASAAHAEPGQFAIQTRPAATEATDGSDPRPSANLPPRIHLPPTTGPKDLPPLDPDALPAPEDRWSSPEAQARHRRVMDELWATKLGQIYLAYLTERLPPVTIPGRANQIVNLITADPDKAGPRVRVIQLFNQDIYAREKWSDDIGARTFIFDQIYQSKKSEGEEDLNHAIVNVLTTTAVVSAPYGFEGVREESAKLRPYLKAWFRCREDCKAIELNIKRLLKYSSLGKYSLTEAGKIFNARFGMISLAYFAWYSWKPGWMSQNKADRELLNGRDDLLDEAKF